MLSAEPVEDTTFRLPDSDEWNRGRVGDRDSERSR